MPEFTSREEYEAWKARRSGTDASGPVQAVPQEASKAPSRESLITDAQAQITWGRDPKGVEQRLVEGGIPQADAREIIAQVQSSLTGDVRRRALLELVGGVILLVASYVLIQWLENNANEYPAAVLVIPVAGVLIFLFGLYRMMTGSDVGMGMSDD